MNLDWLRDLADTLDPPKITAEVKPLAQATTMEQTTAAAVIARAEAEEARGAMRDAIREVLATNSVLVAEDVSDEQMVGVLQHTFGKPGLAETLLMAIKRTGAVTAYRDLVDEHVRVRVAVTRRQREPWPQSPEGPDVPSTVEIDADAETVVRRLIDPEYAATPPLPKEPEQEYSRLGRQPGDKELVTGEAWSAFLEEPTATEETPQAQAPATMGSALLGVRAFGAPDPRKPHAYVAMNDDPQAPCTSCGLTFGGGPHNAD